MDIAAMCINHQPFKLGSSLNASREILPYTLVAWWDFGTQDPENNIHKQSTVARYFRPNYP